MIQYLLKLPITQNMEFILISVLLLLMEPKQNVLHGYSTKLIIKQL